MIKIKKTSEKSIIPKKGSEFAAGYDLYSIDEPTLLDPFQRKLFKTGIHIQIPIGYYGRIAPRSGLALKQGIDVMAGVIDSDYLGEVGVILINLNNEHVTIDTSKAIAQLIIEKHYDMDFELVTDLDSTDRGEKGFGSSDLSSTSPMTNVMGNVIEIKKHSDPLKIVGNIQTAPATTHPGRIYPMIEKEVEKQQSSLLVDRYQKAGGVPVKKKYSDEIKERSKQ